MRDQLTMSSGVGPALVLVGVYEEPELGIKYWHCCYVVSVC